MILGATGRAIFAAAMAATELDDLVDSIFAALPGWARYGEQNATLQGKLASIIEHAEHLDVGKAVANIIANQVEDAIIGRGQARAGAALEHLTGRRTGGIAL